MLVIRSNVMDGGNPRRGGDDVSVNLPYEVSKIEHGADPPTREAAGQVAAQR